MLCKASGIFTNKFGSHKEQKKQGKKKTETGKTEKSRKAETASRPVRVKIFWLSVCDTESLISFVAVVLLFLVVVAAAAADCAHVYYVNYYVAGRAQGERRVWLETSSCCRALSTFTSMSVSKSTFSCASSTSNGHKTKFNAASE